MGNNEMISIILPVHNEEKNLPVIIPRIIEIMKNHSIEIIAVNDGSEDNSYEAIKILAAKYPQVRGISFTRNFGHQAALLAGLQESRGDVVVMMDSDGQHPPELLPELARLWKEGNDVVQTLRIDKHDVGFLKKITSKYFYKIFSKLSGFEIKEGAADYRLISRKVVDAVLNSAGPMIFLRGTIPWFGFKTEYISFEPKKRMSGKTSYTFKKMLSFSLQGIMSFSVLSLRLAIILGILSASLSFLYFVYAIAAKISGVAVPGWTSLIMVILFLGGIQLFILGIIGEYLGKLFLAGLNRPSFVISAKTDSHEISR